MQRNGKQYVKFFIYCGKILQTQKRPRQCPSGPICEGEGRSDASRCLNSICEVFLLWGEKIVNTKMA
jgi:hypothetical protein